MKTKYFIALVLIFVGTNLFTFATTRYWTTHHILIRAQERLDAVLKKDGLYDQVYSFPQSGKIQPQVVDVPLAIRNAGGMYYWWNDGLIYWGIGGLLVIAGVLATKLEPRKNIQR